MEYVGAGIGVIILLIILNLLIGGFFLYLGASIAGIEKKTFGKSILGYFVSLVIVGILSFIFTLLFFFFPPLGALIGLVVGVLITAAILKGIFDTSFGKAFVALIMAWILSLIVTFLVSLAFGASLFGIFGL